MSATTQIPVLQTLVDELCVELYAKSGCERFGMSGHEFAAVLIEVGGKYVRDSGSGLSSEKDLRIFFSALRVEDLALARACAAGSNPAWEEFLTRFREKLYQAALRIAREDSGARELADGLYADLYGTTVRDGARVSKLASYTGRGSLEGWLRTVLAQEYVNRYRRTRRLVSLDEESEDGVQFAASDPEPAPAHGSKLELATDDALRTLAGEDRMVLSAYFLDGRTLAEIARMLGVHESTISRKIDKLAKNVRKQILAGLRNRGLSRRAAEEALEVDVRDLTLDIRPRLTQETPTPAFSKERVMTNAVKRSKVKLEP